MASRELSDLHPDLQPICRQFIAECAKQGVTALVYCTWRSNAEQDQLYAQGRNGNPGSIVTNARGGQSAHNFMIDGKPAAKAFDTAPTIGGKIMWDAKHPHWQIMGRIGIGLGLDWYGAPRAPFREFPHFQMRK